MKSNIAIIGSGPTGIYTLAELVKAGPHLSITVFEIEADVGKGTPYHPDINDQSMLANIASIELPAVRETLVSWLRRRSDADLQRLNVLRDGIGEREFYPRIVLGEYFQSQVEELIREGIANGHVVDVRPLHRVVDIRLRKDDIQLIVQTPDEPRKDFGFDHVVLATGHNFPDNIEIKPGYFVSPWPASALKSIKSGSVGILGTSLSAIDALVTVSTAHGTFYFDPSNVLQYHCSAESDDFHATLMSRKGLLPEADFYCDYPYAPLVYCTEESVDALIVRGNTDLLDNVFDLFKQELVACDPDYSAKIGLAATSVETFASAYFADREAADPFTWAALNLAEAEKNKKDRYTVAWRYAILRMHEVIARSVPYLNEGDLRRFHQSLKSIFIDDYATVPAQSIQRVLALRRAGKLDILRLGDSYKLDTEGVQNGAKLLFQGAQIAFDAFIDATGQTPLSVENIPFPSLIEQQVINAAATPVGGLIGAEREPFTRTGGLDLDAAFRPILTLNLCNRLYCAAISFLLHKLPFVQGITSSRDIGKIVSSAIADDITKGSPNPAFEFDAA